MPRAAGCADAAAQLERHHHALAHFEPADPVSQVHHFGHTLVAQGKGLAVRLRASDEQGIDLAARHG